MDRHSEGGHVVNRLAGIYEAIEGRKKICGESNVYMAAHMVRLFNEVLCHRPQLVVELGVRGGCSTFALEKAAEFCGAKMIAVDKVDCAEACQYADFVQADDLDYAKGWALGRTIDVLMIDTEHSYDHTKAEVHAWMPLLRERCKLIFHDTNASPDFGGVVKFLKEWLLIPFPETESWEVMASQWRVRHYPESHGLTILDRGIDL